MAAGLVATVIERLSSKHRRIDFHVEQATSATLVDRLRERQDELMIGRLPKPFLDEDLTTTILYHDRLRVVAGLQSRWAGRRKITLAEPIKVVGEYEIPVKLHREVTASVKLTVKKEE